MGVSVEICGEAADVAGDRILHQPYVFGTIQVATSMFYEIPEDKDPPGVVTEGEAEYGKR